MQTAREDLFPGFLSRFVYIHISISHLILYTILLYHEIHIFPAFGDSKQWIRTSAVSCVDAWCGAAGAAVAFDGEMVLDALKAGSPVLRATLLTWLAEKLPNSKEYLFYYIIGSHDYRLLQTGGKFLKI